jgi:hypothetical protein
MSVFQTLYAFWLVSKKFPNLGYRVCLHYVKFQSPVYYFSLVYIVVAMIRDAATTRPPFHKLQFRNSTDTILN